MRDRLERVQKAMALWRARLPPAARVLVAALGVALCLATFAPMLAVALGLELPAWEALVYRTAAPWCHQLQERSFVLHGHVFPICARCTGMWLGFTLGVPLAVLWAPRRRAIVGASMALAALALSYLDHLRDQGLGPGWPWLRAPLGLAIFAGLALAVSYDTLALAWALPRWLGRKLRGSPRAQGQQKTAP